MAVRILFFALVLATSSVAASDLAREQRLADQTIDAIFDGEPFFLEAGDHDPLAIHMAAEDERPQGAALILHGRGLHPNWEKVVYPLRTGLAAAGWDTLSVQMPVLGKGAKYYDYVPIFPEAQPRIEAALRYLREQGHERVVLIAHSCGAHMALSWIDEAGDGAIDAFVGIGMGATDYKQPMRKPFPLNRMALPVLDLYGGQDYPAVRRKAPGRLKQLRAAGHPASEQRTIPGADHDMTGHDAALVDTVADWLSGLPS